MKNLIFLPLIVAALGLASSCKKSVNDVAYQALDSTTYLVSSGSITITTNASNKVTFTAPEDRIEYHRDSYLNGLSAYKKVNGVDVGVTLSFSHLNTQPVLRIVSGQYYNGAKTIYATEDRANITVRDFNNIATGVLLKGDFTCSFYEANNINAVVPAYGTIDLKLNKKQ